MKGMENNNDDKLQIKLSGDGSSALVVEKKDRFLPISILIAAIVIGGAVVFASFYKGGSPAAPAGGTAQNNNPGVAAQTATTTSAATLASLGPRDAILGNANAPVTIVEYGDYQCPFCTRYFSQIQPQIISTYINTGKAKMVFRDFAFLGPESTVAANAAQCAEDQGKLWAYHDALYAAKIQDEQKGGSESDGFFNRALFLKLAGQTGLNIPTFTACVDGNKDASIVASEMSAAQAAGVNSTPVTFVNGTEVEVNGQSAGADATTVLAAIQKAVVGK
jgi:protein-disulfide isomerase